MKTDRFSVIIICLLLSHIAYSQDKFTYQAGPAGRMYAKPNFDVLSTDNKEGAGVDFTEDKYLHNVCGEIVKASLSTDILPALTPGSGKSRSTMWIWVDSTGKIMYARFSLSQNDKQILSDDMLYRLYINLKAAQLDVSKMKITFGNHAPADKQVEKGKIYWSVYPMRLNPD